MGGRNPPLKQINLKKMYKNPYYHETSLESEERVEGETIEQKIERIVNNNEPITDGAPIIYTERKEGVKAEYNIRTDRWEIAAEAMDKVQANIAAKREEKFTIIEGGKSEKSEPIQGTATNDK
jgi:hypothetical protein